jgi:ADP-heptose:LPS heptosyltransferase
MEHLVKAIGYAPESIVILRALQLGDLLCAVPAWRAIRAAFPNTTITLVGLPWAESFVQRFNSILDDFIEFPGYPGFPEREPQIQKIPKFIRQVQKRRFDLALQMQGSGGISNPLVALFGARVSAGYYHPGQFCPDPYLYLPYPEGLPEIHRHLALLKRLRIPDQGDTLEFKLQKADEKDFQALPIGDLDLQRTICIHPGARAQERRWPVEKFAAVGDRLFKLGYHIALTGSKDETSLTAAVRDNMHAPAIDLAGQTSLGAMALLLSKARLLVCNDTGVSHLADAVGASSVVLFSSSDPRRWAPLNPLRNRPVLNAGGLEPEAVLAEVKCALETEAAYVR